jgi:hypothetical protein
MYFTNFPYTLYSLDDRETTQLVKNILVRIVIDQEIKNNLSIYDEYDVRDGDTPEIVADKFYNNPELHWIILHLNEILDPRFDWVLSTNDLTLYTDGKYADRDAIHHYINDTTLNEVNGNVYLNSTSGFTNFNAGDVIVNNTNTGTGYITTKISSSNVNVVVTAGGFGTGDQVRLLSNSSITANIIQSQTIPGITAVTNMVYEDEQNESRRRIKVLKPQYVQAVITELKNILEQVNAQ